MQKIFDLAVIVSKFTTRDGKEKSRWENIGSMFERQDGSKVIRIKRSFNPAGIVRKDGSDCIAVSLFPPKQHYDRNSSNEDNYPEPSDYSDKHDFDANSSLNPDDLPF